MSEQSDRSRTGSERRDRPIIHKPDSPPDRILRAGRDLFFTQGFSRVSTDLLAKEAAVSKSTLYKYFPNMVEVLRAVTAAEAERFEAGTPKDVETVDELRAALVRYGVNVMTFLNRAEALQFTQLIYEEARAHPDIAAAFFDVAYGRTLRLVSTLIAQGLQKGFLTSPLSAAELAEQLVGMWEGVPVVRAQMGVVKRPFPKSRDWAEKCVSTLLGR